MTEETITVSMARYKQLLDSEKEANWLLMLESAGVDNWEGFSFAYELKEEAIKAGDFKEEDFP